MTDITINIELKYPQYSAELEIGLVDCRVAAGSPARPIEFITPKQNRPWTIVVWCVLTTHGTPWVAC